MNEEQLADKSNQEILVHLMENYGDMVLRVAFTYVKQRQIAEDISQEIFIKCFKSLDTFQNRSSYQTWLYRITVNYCKDYVRSWSFRKLIPLSVIHRDSNPNYDSVVSHVVKQEENRLLFNKVLNLSVKLREVLILYYYEDLSIPEIANILGVKPSTIKTRLHRARKNLKEGIEGGILFEK
ncbi:sigma-70 family RNA polymerase sigma factor [Gracilibacillus kekensis]|uniref:RNA polymerase sigma-70 factor, ECF subfamily n=1 Tax=Gracilibacillus kekensis TaxID=1027249 RepID=A0A1M7Q2Q0_9BACI|nr:sigma-70 family RNA polymerase sigma factor [Gracilibacillus kekensis]SHN24435.1 RNA polymerase sigma-70 factor, ECF subfamily [Gracilibacillus kekensis]